MDNSDYELDLIMAEGEEIQEILTTLNRAQVIFEAFDKLESLPKGDIRVHNLTLGFIKEDLGCQENYNPQDGLSGSHSTITLIKVLWAKIMKRVSKIINFLKRLIDGGNKIYYDNKTRTNQLIVKDMYDHIRKLHVSDEVKGELTKELTQLLANGDKIFEGYFLDRAEIALNVDPRLMVKYLVGEGEGQEITLHILRKDLTVTKGNVETFISNTSFGGAAWDYRTIINNSDITYGLLWRGGKFLKYFDEYSGDISEKLGGDMDLNRALSGLLSAVADDVSMIAHYAKLTKEIEKKLDIIGLKIKGAAAAGRKK